MAYKNKEDQKENDRRYYLRNAEKVRERKRLQMRNRRATAEGKEANILAVVKFYSKKSDGAADWCDKYDREKMTATPRWLSKEQSSEIVEVYSLARELQWLSEEKLVVDHIVPIQGKSVCGLHVPWNLQIIPNSLNLSKNNRT